MNFRSPRPTLPALLLGLLLAGCGSGDGFQLPPVATPPVPTVLLSVTPAELEVGLSAVLRWSSTDADQCSASGGWAGVRSTAGSESVQPPEGRSVYRLSCTGAGGRAESVVEVLAVQPPPPPPPPPAPSVQLSASATQVEVGASTTLSWSSSEAGSCTASGAWSGSRPTAGQQAVQPAEGPNRYELRCDGEGGQARASVDVLGVVTPPPPRLPTVSLSASPAEVSVGSPSLLSWSSTDARACTASGAWSGSRPTVGNESLLPPTGRSSFRLLCTGDGGSAEALVEILGIVPPPPPETEAVQEFERLRDLEAGCCNNS